MTTRLQNPLISLSYLWVKTRQDLYLFVFRTYMPAALISSTGVLDKPLRNPADVMRGKFERFVEQILVEIELR